MASGTVRCTQSLVTCRDVASLCVNVESKYELEREVALQAVRDACAVCSIVQANLSVWAEERGDEVC